MKAGWFDSKIEDLCIIGDGNHSSNYPTKDEMVANGVPFIRSTNITNGELTDFDIRFISQEKHAQLKKGHLKTGDVLITNRGEIGKTAIVDNRFDGANLNSQIAWLRCKESIFNRYLFYFLNSNIVQQHFESSKSGAALQQFTIKQLKELKISHPNYSEQQRIVAILDQAFEGVAKARANAEQNLQNARALFESYLHSIDTENRELGEFVSIKTGRLDANAAVKDGLYPFFTCSRDVYRIDNYAFDCEAILLAGNNASGDFNVKHYIGKFNAYQRTYVITVKNENEASYRYLYFQLLAKLKEFKKQSVGSNTKFLKIGMIQGMKIPMPSLVEQEAIVVKLDELLRETQRLEALYQRKIACLDELKKSLLQQAFAGEL